MNAQEKEIRDYEDGYTFGKATPLELSKALFKALNRLSDKSPDPKWKQIYLGFREGLSAQIKERKKKRVEKLQQVKNKARSKGRSR